MKLAVWTESSENQGSVGAEAASTGALDQDAVRGSWFSSSSPADAFI